MDFPRTCSKYNRQNSVNLDEPKMYSTQPTKGLFEGEPQAHDNVVSYTVIHPLKFYRNKNSYIASNEIRLTVLFSCCNRCKSFVALEKTRAFIVNEIAFVCEHKLQCNIEYS